MARKSITTTGLSKQIHTLYDYHPKDRESHGTVHDWNYHNIPSVHNTFHQAVENYTSPYSYMGVDLGGVWPRRPTDEGGPWSLGQNPTK